MIIQPVQLDRRQSREKILHKMKKTLDKSTCLCYNTEAVWNNELNMGV